MSTEIDRNYRIVNSPDGALMVRHDGQDLTPGEVKQLYKALRRTLALQRRAELRAAERMELGRAQWVFPKNRHELKFSGDCVYFAESSKRPGWIKIGQSKDVYSRRRSLSKKRPGIYEILAYIQTDNNEMLEAALHQRFEAVRDGRTEFFRAGPVLAFIEQNRRTVIHE